MGRTAPAVGLPGRQNRQTELFAVWRFCRWAAGSRARWWPSGLSSFAASFAPPPASREAACPTHEGPLSRRAPRSLFRGRSRASPFSAAKKRMVRGEPRQVVVAKRLQTYSPGCVRARDAEPTRILRMRCGKKFGSRAETDFCALVEDRRVYRHFLHSSIYGRGAEPTRRTMPEPPRGTPCQQEFCVGRATKRDTEPTRRTMPEPTRRTWYPVRQKIW